MKYLVTGGCGFIGSAFIRKIGKNKKNNIVNIDKLTYAGNLASIPTKLDCRYKFFKCDISNQLKLTSIIMNFKPDKIINFAAESHVDRSINNSRPFIISNVLGTHSLLEASRKLYNSYDGAKKKRFRIVHISTDEVYGDITYPNCSKEGDQYQPNSPYAASKAASDQLVHAWIKTYSLPIITTHCCNNFGPYQLPEKLIPLVILNAIEHKQLPIYGNGNQIREWIYVDDNVDILLKLIEKGKLGEHYNISLENSYKNKDLVKLICKILDKVHPSSKLSSYIKLIKQVDDRPGHDKRYSLNVKKLKKITGKLKKSSFKKQLETTVKWYTKKNKWLTLIKGNKKLRKRTGMI